ncbi:hypothetical protein CEXT_56101 [Caerostris extrusa]|uniref:Uncharacterized protein n=1 Tax=Caerostris extrusa TaxID=172846 RepID=A0AAV4PWD9_CAEEX|nr:hypothetical protein CEXT_56101 [Caerostris extrusa]
MPAFSGGIQTDAFRVRALDAYRLLSGLNCSEMKKRCILLLRANRSFPNYWTEKTLKRLRGESFILFPGFSCGIQNRCFSCPCSGCMSSAPVV